MSLCMPILDRGVRNDGYCPELNPIETLWRKIKYDWMPLACYASYGCMKNAVMEILGGFGHKYQISFV